MGTYLEIPVKVHWTFGLLLLFAGYTTFANGLTLPQSIGFMIYILALFVCVIMHEYGHAIAARSFGIRTRDIILSPIGGLARLEELPQKPIQEFYISLAGPAVNIVIGTVLAIVMWIFSSKVWPDFNSFNFDDPAEFIRYIIAMNFALFVFNLIPAFPMDGGRVLRSLLAIRLGKFKATQIASGIGKIISVGFIIFGILNQQLILSMIGIFIFMMAGMEFRQVRLGSILKQTKAGNIMNASFTGIYLDDHYHKIIEKYQAGEKNFLVFDAAGIVKGAIPELFIKDTIKTKSPEKTAQQLMSPVFGSVSQETSLEDLISIMKKEGMSIVSVTDGSKNILGVLDRQRIEAFISSKEG